jgi:hypothetical protein
MWGGVREHIRLTAVIDQSHCGHNIALQTE